MLQRQLLNTYRENEIKTAGQDKLLIMLYDGAIKNIKNAIELFASTEIKYDQTNEAIKKAQDFITELIVSLDFEKGGAIADNLFSLYTFFNEQLFQANFNKEVGALPDIVTMLEDLKVTWLEVFKNTPIPKTQDYHSVNISR